MQHYNICPNCLKRVYGLHPGKKCVPCRDAEGKPWPVEYRRLLRIFNVAPNFGGNYQQAHGHRKAKIGNRFVRFGWKGCPDVLGQLKDGRLLGVEVKAPKGKLRPEQAVFLDRIRCAGGVAFMARDCRDVKRELSNNGETKA